MYVHAFKQYVTELLDNSQTSEWQCNNGTVQSDYMKKNIFQLGDVARSPYGKYSTSPYGNDHNTQQ